MSQSLDLTLVCMSAAQCSKHAVGPAIVIGCTALMLVAWSMIVVSFLLLDCIYTTVPSPPERRPNVVIADKTPSVRALAHRPTRCAVGIQVVYKVGCAATECALSFACEARQSWDTFSTDGS